MAKKVIVNEIKLLKSKPLSELKKIWKKLFKSNAPPYSRQCLIKRIAYRLQEIERSGMSNEGEKSLLTFESNWGKERRYAAVMLYR